MTVAAPTGMAGVSNIIRLDDSTNRRVALSPSISVVPEFNLGETIFLSAHVRKGTGASSGVAIGLRDSEGGDLFFLRLRDDSTDTIDMRGPVPTAWVQSENKLASRGKWYEVLVAVELHATDITLSTGSLFYREVLGEGSFLPIAGAQGIGLGFTEDMDPLDIAHIRIEQARGSAEFGQISIGTGTIIPEPGHMAIALGACALIGSMWLRRHLSLRR